MEVPAIPFTTLSSRFTPSLRTHTTMNLTELKNTPVSELITLGENMGLENLARMRKQDIIFAILKQHSKSGEDIFGDGVLEILQDGFGFLENPYCNSVVFAKGIPISLYAFGHHRPDRVKNK